MVVSRMLVEFHVRLRALLASEPAPMPVTVPACRCAGRCRCGGVVPVLLLRQIERECEFYRRVM